MILSAVGDDVLHNAVEGPPDFSALYNGGFLIAGALIALLASLLTFRYQREAEDRRKWNDDYLWPYQTIRTQVAQLTAAHGIIYGDRPRFENLHREFAAATRRLKSCVVEIQLIGTPTMSTSANSIHTTAKKITELAAEAKRAQSDLTENIVADERQILFATRKRMKIKEKSE